MNKIVSRFSLIIAFVLFIVTISIAQPPDPPDPTVPIDGGLGFLLAAGMIYGVHRYRKSRKR